MRMAAEAGDRLDWFGAGPGSRAVKDGSASEERDDAPLVESAKAGDRAAFGKLYERYARMVHGILVAQVPVSDADDLVQDVFVMALRKLSSLRDPARFGGWLAAIARNRAHDHHRHSVNAVEWSEELAVNERESGPVSNPISAGAASEAAKVLAAIRSLPDAYKETLILRLVEGMTGPEIAARTGLTPGSVRVNLHRGMQQLRERIGRMTARNEEQQERSSS
jgi:RNA polymerase sigma-70 factor (ECF subfamily)